MAKYKSTNRDDADQMSYSEELAATQAPAEQETAERTDGDDASFRKRYGDLRRHMQQTLSDKDQEIAAVKQQLDQAAKGQIKFPKTDEDIEKWSKKYPDVAQIVDTIARKRANEALEEGEKRLEGLKQLETKISRKEAEGELLAMHPDFAKIRSDSSFHDWVIEQPKYIQDALYKNGSDARAAARAIDLYKADKGIRKKSNSPADAAQAVGKTSRSTPGVQGRASFSESQVQKMSDRDYEKNEDAILEAMRKGNFSYDVTGAAR
jgi:hypothetical protein|tara:strand:- start:59 stop:850 length:792 start_codon:yes stop_codon:yes gene_type:complete